MDRAREAAYPSAVRPALSLVVLASLPLVACCVGAQQPPTSAAPAPEAPAAPSASPPRGVILVSMDTVRADRTTPYGAPAEATPVFAALAAESVVFERAYSQANETLFSHGSFLAGRITSHVAPVDYDFTIPEGTPTLAGQMRMAGYRTGAVVAGGHLARVFGLDDGFDTYTEGSTFGSFQETVPMALRWLDQTVADGAPFFLFLHGYDAHSPYFKPGVFGRISTPGLGTRFGTMMHSPLFYELVQGDAYFPDFRTEGRPNQKGKMFPDLGFYAAFRKYTSNPDAPRVPVTPDDKAFMLGSYASAVLYADLWMGVLMQELERRQLLSTTTVMVISDHGEALLDYGTMSHRHTLRSAATHVPMIVRPAGGAPPVRVATPVSLLDVAPTLLALAGAPVAPGMEGRSLVECFAGACSQGRLPYSEDAIREASVTDGVHRLVVEGLFPTQPTFDEAVRTGSGARFLVYDVASGEQDDRAEDPAMAPVMARLRESMLAVRAGVP